MLWHAVAAWRVAVTELHSSIPPPHVATEQEPPGHSLVLPPPLPPQSRLPLAENTGSDVINHLGCVSHYVGHVNYYLGLVIRYLGHMYSRLNGSIISYTIFLGLITVA